MWFVLSQPWEEFEAGTRVKLSAEDGEKLVAEGIAERYEPTPQKVKVLESVVPEDNTSVTETTTVTDIDPEKIRAEERQRVVDINAICQSLDHPEKAEGYITRGLSVIQAKADLVDHIASTRSTGRLDNGPSANEKFADIGKQAMSLKVFSNQTTYRSTDHLVDFRPDGKKEYSWLQEGEKISDEARQLSGRRLRDIACQSLQAMGVPNPWNLPDDIAARMALSTPWQDSAAWQHAGGAGMGLFAADGAMHSPSHFVNLLRDAVNKRARAGYDVAATTYQIWARQAPSVPDFKTIYRPILGEAGDLDEIMDDGRFPDETLHDHQSTYSVGRYGKRWSVSFKTIVNDDLNALSVVPQRYGSAARMTLNRSIYGLFTDNVSIDTGNGAGNLFNSTALTTAGGHNNDAGAGAPSVAQLNTVTAAMMTQTGMRDAKNLTSEVILNIMWQYLIAPAALRGTVLQLLNSDGNPDTSTAATEDAARPGFSSTTSNIWRGGFQPVIDATLDADSAAAYYFAAPSGIVDTVEYTFLNGFETPRIESEFDFETKGQKMTIEWIFGRQVIDHRGLARAGV